MAEANASPPGRSNQEKSRVSRFAVTSTLTRRAINYLLRPIGLAFAPLTARRPLPEGEVFPAESLSRWERDERSECERDSAKRSRNDRSECKPVKGAAIKKSRGSQDLPLLRPSPDALRASASPSGRGISTLCAKPLIPIPNAKSSCGESYRQTVTEHPSLIRGFHGDNFGEQTLP